jgi:hypothetical protein
MKRPPKAGKTKGGKEGRSDLSSFSRVTGMVEKSREKLGDDRVRR